MVSAGGRSLSMGGMSPPLTGMVGKRRGSRVRRRSVCLASRTIGAGIVSLETNRMYYYMVKTMANRLEVGQVQIMNENTYCVKEHGTERDKAERHLSGVKRSTLGQFLDL